MRDRAWWSRAAHPPLHAQGDTLPPSMHRVTPCHPIPHVYNRQAMPPPHTCATLPTPVPRYTPVRCQHPLPPWPAFTLLRPTDTPHGLCHHPVFCHPACDVALPCLCHLACVMPLPHLCPAVNLVACIRDERVGDVLQEAVQQSRVREHHFLQGVYRGEGRRSGHAI